MCSSDLYTPNGEPNKRPDRAVTVYCQRAREAFPGVPVIAGSIEASLRRLQPQVGRLMINANTHLVEYRRFGFPVWPDEITGYAGPLAGLHAGLSHCDTPYMVSVPCDTPGFPIDLVERLAVALRMAAAEVACAVTGESQAPELHPVFCLLKRELLPSLEDLPRLITINEAAALLRCHRKTVEEYRNDLNLQ